MKTTKAEYFLSYLLMFLLILLSAISSFGQCNKLVTGMDRGPLTYFDYCEGVKTAKMFPGDEAIINQELNAATHYRLVLASDEYLGEVNIELVNEGNDGLLFFNKQESFIDIKSNRNRIIQLKVTVPSKTTSNRIERSGCVAIATSSGLIEKMAKN
jgi:hypothetical protein